MTPSVFRSALVVEPGAFQSCPTRPGFSLHHRKTTFLFAMICQPTASSPKHSILPEFPTPLLALGVVGFPLLFLPRLARKLRCFFCSLVAEDSFPLSIDVTQWHCYTLEWRIDQVIFKTDNQTFETRITPNAPLGFVLWIDNQYAAFLPSGKLAYGTLANPQPAWLEVEEFSLENG